MLEQAVQPMPLKKKMIALLRQEPEIEEILAEHFPRRDEFAHLLNELSSHRHETATRFSRLEEQVDEHDRQNQTRFNDLESRIEAHRIESREGFEQVDQRFEQVDQRFEQVDQRFEQVDQRFEQIDQRFEQIDQRFERVEERLDEHGERLSKIEKDVLGIRRDIFKLRAGQEGIIKRLDQQDMWLKFTTGNLWDQKGERLEDMVAIAMSYGLKNPNISPESIRLRQKLVDTEGLVFKRGFETEVDLIALDDSITVFSVFEVKASLKNGDVDIFALKVELVAAQNPDKEVRGVLIALSVYPEARERCQKYKIELYP